MNSLLKVVVTILWVLLAVGQQDTFGGPLVDAAQLIDGDFIGPRTMPVPWPTSNLEDKGPRVYITPNKQVFPVDAIPKRGQGKVLTCQTAGEPPAMFSGLRWTGPNRTDNHDELKLRHRITEEPVGANIVDLEFVNPTVDDAGIYYCFGNYLTSTQMNASIRVEVNTPIRLENCYEKQPIQLGQTDARITCKITADQPRVQLFKDGKGLNMTRYKWEGDAITIVGPVQPNDAGKYLIKVKSATGDMMEAFIDVQVHWPPTIIQNNESSAQRPINAIEGQQTQLTCLATGNPQPLVYWLNPRGRNLTSEGGYIVNQERGILTILKTNKVDDHGKFECHAYNSISSVSAPVYVNVDIPPEILRFDNVTVNENDQVTFECRAKGDPVPTFSIRRFGKDQKPYEAFDPIYKEANTAPEGGQSLVYVHRMIISATRQQYGRHYCNATNRFGTAEKEAHLFVRYRPDLSLTPPRQHTPFGKRLTVVCRVRAFPSPTVTFWYGDQQILNPNVNYLTSPDGQDHEVTILPNETTSQEFRPITCMASNQMGESKIVIQPLYTTKPGPVIYNVIERRPTSVRLSLVVQNDGSEKIKGFKYTLLGTTAEIHSVYNYPRHEQDWTYLDYSETDSTYVIKNLFPHYRYRMSIRAFNQRGDGDLSDVSFETTKPTRSEPPFIFDHSINSTSSQSSLRISDYRDGYLLRWGPPETDNGDPIQRYTIAYYNKKNPAEYQSFDQLADRPYSARLGPLEVNAQYHISVRAINNFGASEETYIEIHTDPQRPAIPDFSSYFWSAILISAIILIIIIDLMFCLCFQMGVSHSARQKSLQLFQSEDT